MGIGYSESFNVPGGCRFSKAVVQFSIAGAMMPAEIYLNGPLVGLSCNPGNTAKPIITCPEIDITGKLRTGTNTLDFDTVLYPGDEEDPRDDIEVYNLRITLSR